MSNYSKTTDFAAKDSLSTGNANKIVKGTEINDEFSAIQTAVNTKADLNSPTLTGTPVAPTPSASVNNTQIPTTAYVTSAIVTAIAAAKAALFPVGTIYTQTAVATNPGTLLGFGTWEAYGTGRVMVGVDSGNALFDAVNETGGSANSPAVNTTTGATALTAAQTRQGNLSRVRTTETSNSADRTIPATGESDAVNADILSISGGFGLQFTNNASTSDTHTHSVTNGTTTNANYQPFIAVYMWKRTA